LLLIDIAEEFIELGHQVLQIKQQDSCQVQNQIGSSSNSPLPSPAFQNAICQMQNLCLRE